MVKIKFKQGLLLFGIICIAWACGIELNIYQWRKIDVELLNSADGSPISSDQPVAASQYSIKVNMNPEQLTSVRSSDWVSASTGYQSNDQIVSVEVVSVFEFNEQYGAGEDMSEEFDAGAVGTPSEQRLSISNYLSNFGTSSANIDSVFVLYLRPITVPENQPVQFDVLISLSRGGVVSARTNATTLTQD